MKVRQMTLAEGMAVKIDDYPNFHVSGSIRGMKENFYGKDALLVRCGSYIYHVPHHIYFSAH